MQLMLRKAGRNNAGYCFARPQYLCAPLSQQPVLMQYDLRAPQLVRQIERAVLAAFEQLVMQVFSSPLHFIGSACAGCAASKARTAQPANILVIPDVMQP